MCGLLVEVHNKTNEVGPIEPGQSMDWSSKDCLFGRVWWRIVIKIRVQSAISIGLCLVELLLHTYFLQGLKEQGKTAVMIADRFSFLP